MVRERAARTCASFCSTARGGPRRVASSRPELFDAIDGVGTVDPIFSAASGATVLALDFDWMLTMMMLRDPGRMSKGQKFDQ